MQDGTPDKLATRNRGWKSFSLASGAAAVTGWVFAVCVALAPALHGSVFGALDLSRAASYCGDALASFLGGVLVGWMVGSGVMRLIGVYWTVLIAALGLVACAAAFVVADSFSVRPATLWLILAAHGALGVACGLLWQCAQKLITGCPARGNVGEMVVWVLFGTLAGSLLAGLISAWELPWVINLYAVAMVAGILACAGLAGGVRFWRGSKRLLQAGQAETGALSDAVSPDPSATWLDRVAAVVLGWVVGLGMLAAGLWLGMGLYGLQSIGGTLALGGAVLLVMGVAYLGTDRLAATGPVGHVLASAGLGAALLILAHGTAHWQATAGTALWALATGSLVNSVCRQPSGTKTNVWLFGTAVICSAGTMGLLGRLFDRDVLQLLNSSELAGEAGAGLSLAQQAAAAQGYHWLAIAVWSALPILGLIGWLRRASLVAR